MADPVATTGEDADLADVERRRLRALVEVDQVAADELHAHDFQLITPGGASLSKNEYLGAVASGDLNYVVWEPEEIDVRVHLDAGCLRYRSRIKAVVGGEESVPGRFWHTDFYEKRDGRWQVVWSQATRTTSR